MSQAVHVIGNTTVVPGSGLIESKCLPCPGVSGRAIALNPSSSRFYYRFDSRVNVGPLSCAFACKASSNNGYNRRNSDSARQNRHSFTRGRNKQQNDERERERERERDRDRDRDGFENIEESDMLSSKNGPYPLLSNSSRFQTTTAAPGPKEKEIIELFRKVQAQLREKAASKDDKRTQSAQGQGKENETVDSLLKLLRKHSTEQSKRSGGSGSNSREFAYDQQGQNGQYNRGKIPSSFKSNKSVVNGRAQDSVPSFSRPVSNFQRKSPVPRWKFQHVYSDDETVDLSKGRKDHAEDVSIPEMGLEFEPESIEHHEESEPESESESELEAEPELVQLLKGNLSSAEEALIDDEDETENGEEEEDLSGWKLPELRALAKSRGLKGYSKMKKSELVELLNSA